MFSHCSFNALARISGIKHFDKMSKVTLAVSADYEKDGKWVERTNFVEMTVFAQSQIEKIKRSFAVGEWARVEGNVQSSKYERDGTTVYGTDLIVTGIYRLPATLKSEDKK